MHILPLIGVALVMFVSTNIDDIFVLMLFFADRNYTPLQVVVGQYAGIGLLVGASIVISLAALLVPAQIIGLLGFVPIALGIKKLLDLRRHAPETQQEAIPSSRTSLRWLTVSAVTISNGGDNIGVYVPLFANSTIYEIVLIAIIFALLIAVWCIIGYALVKAPLIGDPLRRYGQRILPFVLIGLGIYILVEAYL
jgi:cadmium resistance transport/sequestration family protein